MRAALYFNADMPALGADELLRWRQTYFVLPVGMLGRPLASADMAALAVRTSDALAAKARMARAAGTARRGLTEEAAERLEAAAAGPHLRVHHEHRIVAHGEHGGVALGAPQPRARGFGPRGDVVDDRCAGASDERQDGGAAGDGGDGAVFVLLLAPADKWLRGGAELHHRRRRGRRLEADSVDEATLVPVSGGDK